MRESLKKLRIFAASPSDVASERAKLETVVDSLKPMANHLGLYLEVVDWRVVVPDAGRPQQIIFDQLKPTPWDIFIGILWHRFGSSVADKDSQIEKQYLSGAEEQFWISYRLWKQFSKPRIMLYRCMRPIPLDTDTDFMQAQRIKDFFNEILDPQGGPQILIQNFSEAETFEKLLFNHLQKLLIEYGEQAKTPIAPEILRPRIIDTLPPRAAFFDRSREIKVMMRAIDPADRTWGVLIDGIGGIGKTSLAVETAYRLKEIGVFDAFVFITAKQNILEADGIHVQQLNIHVTEDFLNETARLLGQPDIAKLMKVEKRRALLGLLHNIRVLLIYDNIETISMEEQEIMAEFLRELPQGCKAIVTSRRRGGEGGIWLRLEKLDWDGTRNIIKNEIARDMRLANKLSQIDESRWQELYDETGGSPLALVHMLGLLRVRATMTFDNALEFLRRDRDENLQQFVFEETLKELSENDKSALEALLSADSSLTFETWRQKAKLSRNALERTIDHLSAFSLVDIPLDEECYTLHPLSSTYFRNKLPVEANVPHEEKMQFVQHWFDYAKKYSINTYKTLHMRGELTNLDKAAKWLWEMAGVRENGVQDKNAAKMLIDFINLLRLFLRSNGLWDDWLELNLLAYEAACGINDWSTAEDYALNIAWIHNKSGQNLEAISWSDKVMEARKRIAETVQIFVSYAHEDLEQVRIIYKRLSDSGYRCWLDKENLHGGQDWELEIAKTIKNSDFVLVCLSNLSTQKRGYIQKEINMALNVLDLVPEGAIYLIPVRLDDCLVPTRLSKRQWVDLFVEDGFDKLEKSIKTEIERRRPKNR